MSSIIMHDADGGGGVELCLIWLRPNINAELNASFEDYEDNVNDVIEEIHVEQTLSVSTGGIFETILNLKDWMKQPWSLASEDL